MKRILVVLGLLSIVNAASGLNYLTIEANPINDINGTQNKKLLTPIEPVFSELDGNIFLAIKTNEPINVKDGNVVEFVFDRKTKLVSFHIDDINQDLIDKGEADLFIMIHHDLALELRSKRLRKVNIISGGETHFIIVNSFWTPDKYLASK